LLLLAGVAALAGGIGWLLTAPRFRVAEIEVRGAARLDAAEVLAAAGVRSGHNLFRLDPREIAERLRRLPWVKRALVIRELPNRVVLVIEERVPFALAHVGRLYWLDEDGVRLGAEPRAVSPRLPLVSGLAVEDGPLQEAATGHARTAIWLIRVLLRTGNPLAREISEIDASGRDGPVLYTVEGIEVRVGRDEWEERLARLETVLAQVRSLGEPLEYIDLRFRDQVVFKPRAR
jgi:cell division protein FtsQ